MIIRKLFKFENAHIVRNCSTQRCSQNIHGHSYKVEILLESNYLDNGHMVYDFGLTKLYIKDIIDAFDHAITIWNQDTPEYIEAMKRYSQRWITLPVSPSAEQFSRVFFLLIEKILQISPKLNGEREVKLHSVIVHETETGYAQCFYNDAHSKLMGEIDLNLIQFSKKIQKEWKEQKLWEYILEGKELNIPKTV